MVGGAPLCRPPLCGTCDALCGALMNELLEASSKLSLVRATICRELRADKDWVVIDALLKAEELAKKELKEVLAKNSDKVII